MSSRKDIQQLLRKVRKQGGYTITDTGSNHFRIQRADNPAQQTCCARTPSDYRAVRNVKRELRRIGVNV